MKIRKNQQNNYLNQILQFSKEVIYYVNPLEKLLRRQQFSEIINAQSLDVQTDFLSFGLDLFAIFDSVTRRGYATHLTQQ